MQIYLGLHCMHHLTFTASKWCFTCIPSVFYSQSKIFASGNRKKFKYKFLRNPNLNIISRIMTSGHESLEMCHKSISDCLATGQRATLQCPGQILWHHVINANLWGHRRLNANLYFKCRTGHCLASVLLFPAVIERNVIETHCSKFCGSFATQTNLNQVPTRQTTHAHNIVL